jgi:flagellar motor component MotA
MTLSHRMVGAFLIAFTMLTALLVAPGASFGSFIEIPSLVWIVGIVAGGLFVGFPLETVARTIRAGVFGIRETNQRKLQEYQRVLNSAYQLSWGAGIVGALFGIIIMLSTLSNLDAIGPGLSISLLMLLYAGILAELIINGLQQGIISNAGAGVSSDQQASVDNNVMTKRSMTGKVMAVLFLVLLQFGVLLSTLSTHPSGDFKNRWLSNNRSSTGDEQPATNTAIARQGKWYSYISADD